MHRANGWVIGHAAGTRIVLRPGALLLLAVITVLFGPTVGALRPDLGSSAYLVAAGFGVLLLGSVLLHELAHALVARRMGMDVPEIAVTLLGGHTQIAGATTPGADALVAVVGPATNGVIAIVAALILPTLPPGVPALMVLLLAYANGFVAVLNLLPGLPLDGGRLLEALVWRVTGHRATGTLVGAWAGRALAGGLMLAVVGVPYLLGQVPDLVAVMWAALVAVILWTGAGPFLLAVRRERAVASLNLADLVRPARVVDVGTFVADLDGETVVMDDGVVVGYVDQDAVAAVPVEHRGAADVGSVLVPVPAAAVVEAALTGRDALQAASHAARASTVLVAVDEQGGACGLIRVDDVVAALRT